MSECKWPVETWYIDLNSPEAFLQWKATVLCLKMGEFGCELVLCGVRSCKVSASYSFSNKWGNSALPNEKPEKSPHVFLSGRESTCLRCLKSQLPFSILDPVVEAVDQGCLLFPVSCFSLPFCTLWNRKQCFWNLLADTAGHIVVFLYAGDRRVLKEEMLSYFLLISCVFLGAHHAF